MKKGQEAAFPFNEEVFDRHGAKYNTTNAGMNKRFYAACAAMQGILSSCDINNLKFSFEQVIPKLALMYADELLKQEDEE